MTKRPWLPSSLLLVCVGIAVLVRDPAPVGTIVGCLVVAAGLLFLVAGEQGRRRRP